MVIPFTFITIALNKMTQMQWIDKFWVWKGRNLKGKGKEYSNVYNQLSTAYRRLTD